MTTADELLVEDPGPVSVVIFTGARPQALTSLLECLRQQVYTRFEVIVVLGPGADETQRLLAEGKWQVKVRSCPQRNLSRAHNIGLRAASGRLVAFINDDALPGAGWLAELAGALHDPTIAGAGGLVYERDGFALESRRCSADRLGRVCLNARGPLARLTAPGADEFLYLQGTNACYRRAALEQVHGFDEAFSYEYDEVDLGLRMVDAGLRLDAVGGAPVIHQRLHNLARDGAGAIVDPGPRLRARAIFAVRHGVAHHGEGAVRADLDSALSEAVTWARMRLVQRRMSPGDSRRYVAGARAGLAEGLRVARDPVPSRDVSGEPAEDLLPFLQERDPGHLRVCFLCHDKPPTAQAALDVGGVARYSVDLADGFTRAGHEVHLITATDGGLSSVSWEQGMWVHRVADNHRAPLARARRSEPLGWLLAHAAGQWHEVQRIRSFGPLDVVTSPLYRCEALVCSLDPQLAVITTLHTTVRKVASMHPTWRGKSDIPLLIAMEDLTVAKAGHLHALSEASIDDVREHIDEHAAVYVEGLGVRDRLQVGLAGASREEPVGILFVGRLERRKGVDVLLEAFENVLARCPDARLTIVGQATENTELGVTYQEAFESRAQSVPGLRDAVAFLGAVDDDRLAALYAASLVVCAPSRYESFGLVNVEAMSFAKPIVTCGAGGPTEVLRDGVDALLVAPEDPPALADALVRVLEDPQLRRRLGEAARERFEQRYELSVAVGRIAAMYRSVAAAERSTADSLQHSLAEILVTTGASTVPEAPAAAVALLDRTRHPIDHEQALWNLQHATDGHLLETLYVWMLGRKPSLAARLRYGPSLARGQRAQVVRCIATSPEAVRRWGDPTWLDAADRLPWPGRSRRLAVRALRGVLRGALRLVRLTGARRALERRLSPGGRVALYRAMSPVRRTMVRLGVDSGLSALKSHGEPTRPAPRS